MGGGLRWYHLLGAFLGLVGTALLVTGGGQVLFRVEYAAGYAAALGGAVVWSLYSVINRRYAAVPTDAVGGFCAVTALLASLCHAIAETTVWPVGVQWLAVLFLGIGPLGLAFFVWDYGVKHGNLKALGGFSYLTPLLSTFLLIAFGAAALTLPVVLACLFIVGGAILAGRELWAGATR
jgi:drug/metabolite transporter (DMT)-like permease